MPNRKDQYIVSLAVDGYPLGVFDMLKGGDVDSNEVKYTPGGIGGEISLGGNTKTSNITLTRLYDRKRDHPLTPWLISRIGKAQCVAAKQPLDDDGNQIGDALTWRGVLKHVTWSDYDSNGTSAADTFDIEISTQGTIS